MGADGKQRNLANAQFADTGALAEGHHIHGADGPSGDNLTNFLIQRLEILTADASDPITYDIVSHKYYHYTYVYDDYKESAIELVDQLRIVVKIYQNVALSHMRTVRDLDLATVDKVNQMLAGHDHDYLVEDKNNVMVIKSRIVT